MRNSTLSNQTCKVVVIHQGRKLKVLLEVDEQL